MRTGALLQLAELHSPIDFVSSRAIVSSILRAPRGASISPAVCDPSSFCDRGTPDDVSCKGPAPPEARGVPGPMRKLARTVADCKILIQLGFSYCETLKKLVLLGWSKSLRLVLLPEPRPRLFSFAARLSTSRRILPWVSKSARQC